MGTWSRRGVALGKWVGPLAAYLWLWGQGQVLQMLDGGQGLQPGPAPGLQHKLWAAGDLGFAQCTSLPLHCLLRCPLHHTAIAFASSLPIALPHGTAPCISHCTAIAFLAALPIALPCSSRVLHWGPAPHKPGHSLPLAGTPCILPGISGAPRVSGTAQGS